MIKIYSGYNYATTLELHPLKNVEVAYEILKDHDSDEVTILNTNSPDFISSIYHINKELKLGVAIEFYVDGVKVPEDDGIEPVFADFNRAIDKINEICGNDIRFEKNKLTDKLPDEFKKQISDIIVKELRR